MDAEKAARIRAACLDFSRGLYPGEVGVEDVLETSAILYAWQMGALEISFEQDGVAADEAGPDEEPAASGEGEPFDLADLRVLVRPVSSERGEETHAEELERLEECLAESGWRVRQLKRRLRLLLCSLLLLAVTLLGFVAAVLVGYGVI